jgi:predicted phosphodiesterase
MPLHVTTLGRRDFLIAGGLATFGLATGQRVWADDASDANRIALLSDTHIPESADVVARGVNMTANLRQVVAELVSLTPRPSGVLINGDCAYLKGLPADYANLAACVAPLANADLPLHLTMGNHDDRGPLYDALSDQRPETPVVESKHISVLRMPHANFFLLDTLFQVNVVTGELGGEQLTWLAKTLDENSDKPAVIVAHHNPQFTPPEEGKPWGGVRDTEAWFATLTARPHVKAVVFGHTHNWSVSRHEGLHLINLPPVAYVFGETQPNGWVDARLRSDGIDLTLRTIDPADERHGTTTSLNWLA